MKREKVEKKELTELLEQADNVLVGGGRAALTVRTIGSANAKLEIQIKYKKNSFPNLSSLFHSPLPPC